MAKQVLIILGWLLFGSIVETLISTITSMQYGLNLAYTIGVFLMITVVIAHVIYVKYAKRISKLHVASMDYAIVFIGVVSIASIAAATKDVYYEKLKIVMPDRSPYPIRWYYLQRVLRDFRTDDRHYQQYIQSQPKEFNYDIVLVRENMNRLEEFINTHNEVPDLTSLEEFRKKYFDKSNSDMNRLYARGLNHKFNWIAAFACFHDAVDGFDLLISESNKLQNAAKQIQSKIDELSWIENLLAWAKAEPYMRIFGIVLLFNAITLKLVVTACKYYQTT